MINIYNCDICSFLVVKEKILFVSVFKENFVFFHLVSFYDRLKKINSIECNEIVI